MNDSKSNYVSPVDQVVFISSPLQEEVCRLYQGALSDGLFSALFPVPQEIIDFRELSQVRQAATARWHGAVTPLAWKKKMYGTRGDIAGSAIIELIFDKKTNKLSITACTEDLPFAGYKLLVKAGFDVAVYYASPSVCGRLRSKNREIIKQEFPIDRAPDDIRQYLNL